MKQLNEAETKADETQWWVMYDYSDLHHEDTEQICNDEMRTQVGLMWMDVSRREPANCEIWSAKTLARLAARRPILTLTIKGSTPNNLARVSQVSLFPSSHYRLGRYGHTADMTGSDGYDQTLTHRMIINTSKRWRKSQDVMRWRRFRWRHDGVNG